MANQYETLANARQKGIEKYLWNDQQGWYADYDLKSHKVRNQLTAAALFPLYVNAAAKDRANKMATATKTHLLQPGGLNTTSVKSGQQWDAPNGWAPLQWVATEGLQNYGQKEVAMDISWHFLTNVQHTYDREKKLVEKYDVSTTGTGGGGGEYPLQDGFGWTNGVTLKMLDLICPKEQPCDNVPATRPTVKSATTQPSTKEAQPTPLPALTPTTSFGFSGWRCRQITPSLWCFLHRRFFKSWREVLRKCLPYVVAEDSVISTGKCFTIIPR